MEEIMTRSLHTSRRSMLCKLERRTEFLDVSGMNRRLENIRRGRLHLERARTLRRVTVAILVMGALFVLFAISAVKSL